MMTPELLKAISRNSCVAVLPHQTVQEIMETGAPTMLLNLKPNPADNEDGLIKVAAWGLMAKKWPKKTTLRVRFIGGDTRQRDLTLQRMAAIDALAPAVTFRHVTSGPSEIRVAFHEELGHWSYLGTDCKSIPSNQQTMNLGLTARDSSTEWDRVALHETLHALAFNHEHQHPRSQIPWNVEAVYEYYSTTQGWSRAEIDAQVLRRSNATNIFGSDPDPKSIMMYPIAKQLLLDPKFAVGWNTKMSPTDIAVLKREYA